MKSGKAIYVVTRPIDTIEGRGPYTNIGYFTRRDTAQAFANAMEPYGRPGQFCSVTKALLLDCSPNQLKLIEEEQAKQKALSKLTEKEI